MNTPILSRDCQALESIHKLTAKFAKGLRKVPYEAALQRLRIFSQVRRGIRGGLIYMYKIMTQFLLPPPILGFAVKLSGFTNNSIKPVAANMRTASE